MDNLDRLLREQYGRTPPASPPPEGWKRLSERLHETQEDDPPPPPWWHGRWPLLLLLSLALAGMVVFIWHDRVPARRTTEPQGRVAGLGEEGGATRQSDAMRSAVTETVRAPVPAISGVTGPKEYNVPAEVDELPVSDAETAAGAGGSRPGERSEPHDASHVDQSVLPIIPAGTVRLPRAPATLVAALPLVARPRLRSGSSSPTRILERMGILDELVMATTSTTSRNRNGRRDPWVFQRTSPYGQPPASWEVAGRAFAWPLGEATSFIQGFQREPVGATGGSRRFLLPGGDPIRLYPVGDSGWRDYPGGGSPRFSLLTAGVEVAYRMPIGLRFSVGGVLLRYPGQPAINTALATENLAPGSYLLVERDLGFDEYWMTVGVQFTVNRRRRFRIHVGLQALGMIYETYSGEEYLVGPDLEEPLFTSRYTTNNANFLSWSLPTPQLTFEYQLRRNLSLTAGIGGMSGLGASYSFARRSWNPPPATFY